MSQICKKQRGFSLPVAIFVIVVLSIFIVSLLKITMFSQQTSNFHILKTKAYFAAKAGLDYGMYQATANNICLSTTETITLSESHFAGFKFSYVCEKIVSDEGGTNYSYYKITSNGCNSTGTSCPDAAGKPSHEDYVEKSMIGVGTN